MGELSSCDRDCTPSKVENIYSLALHRKCSPTPDRYNLSKTFRKITRHIQAENGLTYISIVAPHCIDIMCLPLMKRMPLRGRNHALFIFLSPEPNKETGS